MNASDIQAFDRAADDAVQRTRHPITTRQVEIIERLLADHEQGIAALEQRIAALEQSTHQECPNEETATNAT